MKKEGGKMCDQNFDESLGIPVPFLMLVDRVSERSLDGVVIVDDKFNIRLANPTIVQDFPPKKGEKDKGLSGRNYFDVFFGLDMEKDLDRIKNIPLYKAIITGKDESDADNPYPIFAARNKIAYQLETRVADYKIDKSQKKRVALEFWRRMGDPDVFQEDPDYIKI